MRLLVVLALLLGACGAPHSPRTAARVEPETSDEHAARPNDGALGVLHGVDAQSVRVVQRGAQSDAVGSLRRGSLAREDIRRVIREQAVQHVRICYETELASTPELQGRIMTSFIIGEDGRVASAAVTSDDIGNATLTDCIVAVVRQLRFPPPEGGGIVGVNYPWVLSSSDD